MRSLFQSSLIIATMVALCVGAWALPTQMQLRGYGRLAIVSEQRTVQGQAVDSYQVQCEDAAHAVIFASKLLSDYQVLHRNTAMRLTVQGVTIAGVQAPEGWVIAPVVRKGDARVTVVCAPSPEAAMAAISAMKLPVAGAIPVASLAHPLYLDKWDRYCFGFWHRQNNALEDKAHLGADGKPDAKAFYQYVASKGLVVQGANFFNLHDASVDRTGLDTTMPYLKQLNLPYQFAAWLPVDYDLQNRNPAQTMTQATGFTPGTSYYGDVPFVPSQLEDAQNASYIEALKQVVNDDLLMSLLEPHGEAGPFPQHYRLMQNDTGRQDFIHFLRDERRYDLPTLSQRWFGRRDAVKAWNEVKFPDLRTFYGWNASCQTLSGDWRTHSDAQRAGEAAGWGTAEFDDQAWRTTRLPGDQTVNFGRSASWFRVRFDLKQPVQPAAPLYLTVVSLNHGWGDKPGLVYLNGVKIGEIRMRDWYVEDFGQFDIAKAVKPTGNVLALLMPQGYVGGPVFLGNKPMEDFPTSDPCLNLQKVDYNDWIAYTIGAATRRSMQYIRSVDPNRAAKFHAMNSEWVDRTMQDYGGYPHCTGEGAFWRPFDKHYGIARGLQDSSEAGGSTPNIAALKNLFAMMWLEGMNAHDYFHNLPNLINDPQQLAYFDKMLPYMRLMGCMNIKDPQVAILAPRRSPRFQGEWVNSVRMDLAHQVMGSHRSFVYIDEGGIEDNLMAKSSLWITVPAVGTTP